MSTQAYRDAHKAEQKAHAHAYYLAHKEHECARAEAWRQAHTERINELQRARRKRLKADPKPDSTPEELEAKRLAKLKTKRAWDTAHAEERKAYNRAWYLAHKQPGTGSRPLRRADTERERETRRAAGRAWFQEHKTEISDYAKVFFAVKRMKL